MKRAYTNILCIALLCTALMCYITYPSEVQATINDKARLITKNPIFDCPIISLDAAVIKSATCDNSDGSITGITVTPLNNKMQYTWYNASGKNVGNKLNLTGVPPGIYTLEVIDNAGCPDGIKSPGIKIEGTNNVKIIGVPTTIRTTSDCSTKDGAIIGLKVTGATKYVWSCLENGATYTSLTTPDIYTLPQGTYTLIASDANCSVTSSQYVIQTPQGVAFEFPVISAVTIKQPTCGQQNGSLNISFSRPTNNTTIYWILLKNGEIINSGLFVQGAANPILNLGALTAGNYYISVGSETNRCYTKIGNIYKLNEAQVVIYPDSSQVYNDNCNQHMGAILPFITGSTPPKPQSGFRWTDVQTNQLISTQKTLTHVGAGTYRLDVEDPFGCTASATFVIRNDSPPISPPIAEGSTICLPGKTFIISSNAETGGEFRLYKSVNDSIPIATSKTGTFYQMVDETTDFYISYARSDCESVRTKITVTVLVNIKIPNAFTPNGDAINDTWVITGLENFPGAEVRVFNRSGQQIFYSVNNSILFNGYYNTKALPAGVYYYFIDVKENKCFGKISGSLTIIR